MLAYAQTLRDLCNRIAPLGDLRHRVTLEIVAEIAFAHHGLLTSKLGKKASTNLGAVHLLPAPSKDERKEIVPVPDLSVIGTLLKDARLFEVNGRSAEPIALNNQFLITRYATIKPEAFQNLDGRLVIAVDESGARYFKRFRYRAPVIVLESLNPDGTTPAEVLCIDDELSFPKLTGLLEVVGVLFEYP